MTTVYVLLDDNQIRYIGKTTKVNLEEKLAQHQKEALENPGKFTWMNELHYQGRKAEIKPIISYEDEKSEHFEKVLFSDLKFFLGVKLSNTEKLRMQSIFQQNAEAEAVL